MPGTSSTSGKGPERRLAVGIGNEYRRDDGLGIVLAGLARPEGFDVVAVPGITPDLAETLCEYDMVVFMDASVDGEPVELGRVRPGDTNLPLSHHVTCEGILALTEALYHRAPEAYLLSMRGYDFDHGEGLSRKARKNLEQALVRLGEFCRQLGGS